MRNLMRAALCAASLALLGSAPARATDNNFPTPGGATADGKVSMCVNSGGFAVPCNASSAYPTGASPVTASATGTTGATTATLPAASGKTTYLCGFSIRANATAAATGNATVTGTVSGTLNFTQWTAPLASGIGITEPQIGSPCIPASAQNTSISIVSAAPGAGGTVSVAAWGYQN